MTERLKTAPEVISREWTEAVRRDIEHIAGNSLADTPTGAVLKDVLGTSGKMIRPRLLLLCSAFGPDWRAQKDVLCRMAAMAELTHLASLIHDDIVDEAPFRRGKPSIQSKYGKDAAVYAGDYLIARINYFQAKDGLRDASEELSKAMEEMCIGEIGQARIRYREDVTTDQYLQNIRGKTAALFAASCRMGARRGGCDAQTVGRLSQIGCSLGILFQLRDDLLDFTTSSREAGKETHKDFRDGIYTMPVLKALEHPEGRKKLLPYMRMSREGQLNEEEVAAMERAVEACGGTRAARDQIRGLCREIEEQLECFQENPAAEWIGKLVRLLAPAV